MLFLVGAMFLSGCGGLMFYNHLGGIFTARLDASAANVTAALLIVGLVGVLAVLFGGILTDEAGPRRADTFVLVGHCLALGAWRSTSATPRGVSRSRPSSSSGCGRSSRGLEPVMQAGIMAASPERAMLAMSPGISGLYGGSAVGAAVGGYLLDQHGQATIPVVDTVFLAVTVVSAVLGTRPVAATTVTNPVATQKPTV